MKILVFGSSGQVARSLAAHANGEMDIMCLGRPEGDITSVDAIRNAVRDFGADFVVNAAAYTAVDAAETDVESAFRVNETGPKYLAEVCAEHDIPLIHYSTDYVFDGTKPGPYLTDDPVRPLGVYGKSKEAGESAVRAIHSKHVILRTAWVFSPFGKNFVKTMLTLGRSRDSLNVVADQFGNPTYAPDIAVSTLRMISGIASRRDDPALYGTFHMTNTEDASWYDFATEIFRQAEAELGITCSVNPIPSTEFPTPVERPKNSRLDGAALEASHGIVLRPWKEALSDCLTELRSEI